MTTEAQYAKAFRGLVRTNPGKTKELIGNLKAALARRGHTKLLPKILNELEKLQLGEDRASGFREITPERERTRVLFELYKKLVTHHG